MILSAFLSSHDKLNILVGIGNIRSTTMIMKPEVVFFYVYSSIIYRLLIL